MKKLLSVVLATLMLLSVFPLALPQNVTAATTERIAYFDQQNGDDDTAELGNRNKAFATLKAAYNALTPEGGKLVFLSTNSVLDNSDITGLNAHYGEITITSIAVALILAAPKGIMGYLEDRFGFDIFGIRRRL